MVVLKLVFLSIFMTTANAHGEWEYNNNTGKGMASEWYKKFPKCDGLFQSPINIITESTRYNAQLKEVTLRDSWKTINPGLSFILENNGHTVKISIEMDNEQTSSHIQTNFNGQLWTLVQLHYHWSDNDNEGSEHLINGKQYAGELHMIHINPVYGNLHEAMKNKDGLMVFGFFIDVKSQSNDSVEYDYLFNEIPIVLYKDLKVKLRPLILTELIPLDGLSEYYTYQGSLTTPTCDEAITWVVFNKHITIATEKINLLRDLRSQPLSYYRTNPKDKPIGRFRPVQPLNGRTVERSFDSSSFTLEHSFKLISLTSLLYFSNFVTL